MKVYLLTAVFCCSVTFLAFGQKINVNGLVTDSETGDPLVGATVNVKGTEKGTITDDQGRFAIQVTNDATLLVSFVGFEKKEISDLSESVKVDLVPSYDLESVIVQGVRAKKSDPVSHTTLSKKEIEREYVGQHPIFILDKQTPGIYSYSESGSAVGNYGQIRLRGISQERINFTLNGVPLNDMIDHGVFFSNFSDISSSFESIQVQRGVGTSSTGVASYAGSINFETINLKRNPAFSQIEMGAGSFNTYRANAQVNTSVNEKGFGLYSSVSKLWSDGYRDHTGTTATSVFLSGGYFGEKDLIRVTAFSGRSENGLGYYPIPESTLEEDPTFNNLTANDKDDFEQFLVQLQYSRELSSSLKWSNTAYYGGAGGDFAEGTPDVDSVFVENYFTQYNTTFFSINYPLENDHYGLISNLFYNSDRLEISGGVHAYTFRRENREAILPDNANPYYQDKTQKDEVAAFVKAKYQLIDRLAVFGDLQFRTMKLEFFPDYDFIYGDQLEQIDIVPPDPFNYTFLNPKVGVNYQINPQVNAFVSYGRSGREPTRIDLIGGFQLNENSLSLLEDPGFQPEYVNDFEAGVTVNTNKLALQGNLYFMDFKNEIAPIGEIIAFGVQRRQNIPESYRAGVEMSWNYLLIPGLNYRGNASYMRSRISEVTIGEQTLTDVTQILSPEWITSQGIQYSPVSLFTFSLDANYMSEQFMEYTNDDDFVVPSYFTVDLSLETRITDSWKVNVMVNNITDEQYYTYGAPVDVDFDGVNDVPGFLIQPPRNIFLTTTIRF